MIYKERETGWRELTYPKVGEAFLTVKINSQGKQQGEKNNAKNPHDLSRQNQERTLES